MRTHRNHTCVECRVVGDPISWYCQFLLPIIVLIFLIGLWRLETKRRSFLQFVMDNLKQGVAAAVLHFIGLAVSKAMFEVTVGADECEWYFLFFVADAILGLALTIGIHHMTARIARHHEKFRFLSTIGVYDSFDGSPTTPVDRTLRWLGQLAHYLVASSLSRGIVFIVLFVLRKPSTIIVEWLFSWQCSEAEKDAMLVIILIIVPIILDAFQVGVQNWWLKDRTSREDGKDLLDAELHEQHCQEATGHSLELQYCERAALYEDIPSMEDASEHRGDESQMKLLTRGDSQRHDGDNDVDYDDDRYYR